jgi:uncharacterized phage infection (PIP) family protein YhgE
MGYLPRKYSPKGTSRKPLQEKSRSRKYSQGRLLEEENRTLTEKGISEATLKRLHTLGSQKFGSSPFSQHFVRWLANVEAVLAEFESHPTIGVDDQFLQEYTQTLAAIRQQLEDRRRKEATVDQEIVKLSERRNDIQQINTDYVTAVKEVKARKRGETKRIQSDINRLKKEQDRVIRLKTGFFRGISKKERERKEAEITQELVEKQNELELATLNFNAQQRKLREEYEEKREPVLEQIKFYRQLIRNAETDGSLEERWFACEALIDAVNTFLQRKASQSPLGPT